ncbi:hypothetical protein MSMAT_1715 [Methanosarcina mazei TMA]|uniref:ATP-binding protein n=1 Tax=Methanosarcina mazei TaxID=2209 RepID=UPI001C33A0C4|nr:ATP-binding protein [Methanosarcina mazei]UWJ22972.1 hypothetical protein MSMAT_1715 [Methanosarcina mazei TMA]BBL65702.1 hypothetical protein MmazTMA_26790 [Methanosarcina mazei]
MSTAKAIDSITDSSKFERLMNSILRRSNPIYTSIIETGVNTEGKTIKGRVDAFGRVLQSTKPEYIMIEHTTVRKEDLEIKWLSETVNKEGDLVKAGKEAIDIKKKIPDAEFTLILTTNRRFTHNEDEPLYIKLDRKAKEFGIKLEIWEQSRIVDYLDNEPYGHWFRKKFLGITAELLSKPLFFEICEKSLKAYSSMLLTNNDELIPRDYDDIIEKSILNTQFPIHLIIGESGVGKSTIINKFLERCLKREIYALWIPAEVIQESIDTEDAIKQLVLKIHPTIFLESINSVINEIAENKKIILIIDDINNLDKPKVAVQKLFSWSKPKDGKKAKYSIICPIWPNIWYPISLENKGKEWIDTLSVGYFSEKEGQKAVQLITEKAGFKISCIKARNLAKKLGNDPFLIDSFSAVISFEDEQKLETLTNNVLDNYILKETDRVSSQLNSSFLPQEYQIALYSLCSSMLYNRKFFPKLHEIKQWFMSEPDTINAIKELVKDQKLCRLDENHRLIFKHDRLLNYLQVKALANMIISNEDIDIILSEPYYAEIIGQAILKVPYNEEILLKLYKMNILSLFESIRHFETNSSSLKDEITKLVTTWSQNKNNFESESILESICQSLIEIDSEIVINITENMPKNHLTLLARLRNGCVLSGIEYCISHREFEPSFNFLLRDLIIEQAKVSHEDKIKEELIKLLVSDRLNDDQRAGALILMGYFQFDKCEEKIICCWNLSENKENVLNAALWAGLNCFRLNIEFYFEPLITFWSTLPDAGEQEWHPLKNRITSDLRLAFGYKTRLNTTIINFLAHICDCKKSLIQNIQHILNYIDNPEAVEFIVNRYAENSRSNLTFTNPWNTKMFDYAHKLSKNSRIRLRSLWEGSCNDKMKKAAFKLWATNVEQSELDLLRQISYDSPLFDNAIFKRAELGDRSVVRECVDILHSNPYLFYEAQNIWCNEIMEVARSYLSSFKDNIPSDFSGGYENVHFNLYHLLLFIPERDAEILLTDYWDHLKYSPLFIQIALYLGTPKCLEIADLAIKECPQSIELFRFVTHTFEANIMGYRTTFREKKINNLLPYLSLFKYDKLSHLTGECERNNLQFWAHNHLYGLLSDEDKKFYFPTDDDLVAEIKTRSKEGYILDYIEIVWIKRFEERKDPKSRIFKIIETLLEFEPTLNNLLIAALCIKVKGNRADINLLKNYTYLIDEEEVSKVLKDTEYFLCRKTLN